MREFVASTPKYETYLPGRTDWDTNWLATVRNLKMQVPVARNGSLVRQLIGLLAVPILIVAMAKGLAAQTEKTSGEGQITATIYVAQNDPRATDSNPGTRILPVLTLNRALMLATRNLQERIATRILVARGVYRESLTLRNLQQYGDTPLVLEAEAKGQAVITGSERWTDWKKIGVDLYVHPWNLNWGLGPYPAGWEKQNLAPIIRRREMVFVGDSSFHQALSMVELQSSDRSFFVSEPEHRIYVRLPSERGSESSDIEVTTRSTLLEAQGMHNLTLRGLVFEHAGSSIDEAAVSLDNCDKVVIDRCEFRWNNWTGLSLRSSRDVSAFDNEASYNGGAGMTLWRMKNIDFESNETSFNNWRGELGGFRGWAVAGIKSLRIHNGIFRKHRAVDNHARGFWLDFDCANVTVEDGFFCRNASDGAFVEGSQGPIDINKSIICHNQKGLVIANSPNATLRQNIVYGNAGAQILVGGEAGGRLTTDWETNRAMVLDTLRLKLVSNAVVAQPGQQLMVIQLTSDQTRSLLSSLTSNENTWYGPTDQALFEVAGKRMDFASWREIGGQDSNSKFQDPLFVDPEHDNFELRSGSPLARGH